MSNIDNQPLRYWNGQAVYLTLYLTIGLAAGYLLTLILGAAKFPVVALGFFPATFLHGALWQPFTYIFVNPLDFFAPLSLVCFYFWGVEVEKYLGRRLFLSLCGTLVLLPVVISLVCAALFGGAFLMGLFLLVSGLLIAFATLYPDMDYLGGWVPLKWFAFVCIACQSITYFPNHDWGGLFMLWATCGAAFVMVRYARGNFAFRWQWPSWLRRKPKFRVVPKPAERIATGARRVVPAPTSAETEIDTILDKIARSGLASLSAAERERLEKARLEMLRKGP